MTSAPILGEDALPLTACSEEPSALLAATTELADGSEAMRSAQAEYARDSRLPVEVVNTIGLRLRLVPPGSCVIGSPEGEPGRGTVETQHVRTVYRPFYLGKFEVTQAEFAKVMGRNPSGFRGPRRPVEEVTWTDAQQFCIKLNTLENLPKNTYRLPAEEEWEYACRAGTSTAYYSGSKPADLDRVAETGDNNYRSTRNVGGRPPNALGLYNMHGNVWEWCLNWYARYPGDATPITEDEKRMRSLRGGNWYVRAPDCRSAERGRLAPTSHGNMLGFRVLREIPELGEKGSKDILPLDSLE
jgi:formylglycine-generating enzyme required for sulfatase activity